MKPITLGQMVEGEAATIDLDYLVETRLLIQANSGAGKSWALRRLLEQSFGKVQQLVIDPEGEFASLRERYDYVLAGRGGEATVDPRSARLLARRLLELNASTILDIYELRAHERVRFVRLFLEALVDAPRELWHPCLIIIDEAHVFAPQRGEAESLGPVIDLATRGRKRGYCAVLATQRLSKLHKDAAAETNNKLIGRSALDVDMKRASEELGFVSRDDQQQLRSLAPGEFFAFGPAITSVVRRVMIGGVETTHPKIGTSHAAPPPPPSDKVKAVLGKLADLAAEADEEADQVRRLQVDNATLKRQLSLKGSDSFVQSLQAENTRLREQAKEGRGASEAEIKRRIDEATRDVRRDLSATARAGAQEAASFRRLAGSWQRARQQIEGALAKLPTSPDSQQPITVPDQSPFLDGKPLRDLMESADKSYPVARYSETPSANGLKAGAVRILRELASRYPAAWTKSQLGALTGFTPSGGTFSTYISELRRRSLINVSGKEISVTEQGLTFCGDVPAAPRSHDEVMQMWRGALKAGCYRMLEEIVRTGAEGIDKFALAEATGFTASGGTYSTYLSILRRNGLVEINGSQIVATDILWPEPVPA